MLFICIIASVLKLLNRLTLEVLAGHERSTHWCRDLSEYLLLGANMFYFENYNHHQGTATANFLPVLDQKNVG
jgi:hypothetical protein